jgi:hypothetical protein
MIPRQADGCQRRRTAVGVDSTGPDPKARELGGANS